MSTTLLGSGNVLDAAQIQSLLVGAPSNQRVLLQVDMSVSPGANVVNWLQSELISKGVPGVEVSTGSPILNISWINTSGVSAYSGPAMLAPIAIVAIILAAIAVIALVVLGWRLFSVIPDSLKAPLIIAGVAALAILGLVIAYRKFRGER
jgi:hypothetical protein